MKRLLILALVATLAKAAVGQTDADSIYLMLD